MKEEYEEDEDEEMFDANNDQDEVIKKHSSRSRAERMAERQVKVEDSPSTQMVKQEEERKVRTRGTEEKKKSVESVKKETRSSKESVKEKSN